ncbi:hypothetical protein VPHD530_0029 [Vibrio phage D530]
MAMKYLPIHRSMAKLIKTGMSVIHNGKGNRQGMKAVIKSVKPDSVIGFVRVRYCETGATQAYSREWFLDNFYLFIGDIKPMGGFFNGEPFVEKYSKYACTNSQLKKGHQHTHVEVKALVEAKEEGYTSVISDNRDPLDEVGDFILVSRGQKLSGQHKTQRIAELAAAKHTRENKCCVAVFKLVAQSNVVVDAEIIRK